MHSTITISSDGMDLLPDSSKNPVNRQSGYHPISLPKGKSYLNILSKFSSVTRLSKLLNRSLASSIPIGSISGGSHSPGSRPQCQRQLPVRYSALSFSGKSPLWQRRQYVAARARRRSILSRRRNVGRQGPG